MSKDIYPRHNWVLVKPEEVKRETESGLVVPEAIEKEQPAKGVVIRVGPEVKDLEPGMLCIYGKYAGEQIQNETEEQENYRGKVDLMLVLEEDILAFIK